MNNLYFGDNLWHLREHIAGESVDLVYLDPPFNSQAQYNVFFRTPEGEASEAQAEAFRDTWSWTNEAELAFDEIIRSGSAAVPVIDALRRYLRESDMMAYLVMMTSRLIELRRVLKRTGSIYLHCDPTASHYLKVLLDGVFGMRSFTNEIIWQRTTPKGLAFTKFASSHDVLLFYRVGEKFAWNAQYKPYSDGYRKRYNLIDEATGRPFQATSLLNPNKNRPNLTYEFHGYRKVWRWTQERMLAAVAAGKIYLPPGGGVPRERRFLDEQEGVPITSVWTDIPPVNAVAQERLGYPTQKPVALLERIINASTNEGDVVLDPFCGCGTTIEAAERARRKWIGIDITHYAVTLIDGRLKASFPNLEVKIEGRPEDLAAARLLAEEDPYQFQWWANWLVGVQNYRERKRGPDRGIDGIIFFPNGPHGIGRIVVSVKSGKLKADDVRALSHVVQREQAQIGLLVTLEEPSDKMIADAASAGIVRAPNDPFPRLQIVTVERLLKGFRPNIPKAIDLPELDRRASRRKLESDLSKQLAFKFVFANSAAAKTSNVVDHLDPTFVMRSYL